MNAVRFLPALALCLLLRLPGFGADATGGLSLEQDDRVVIIGNGLGSRMMQFGRFEAEVHRRHPGKKIVIRNMSDEGDTPGFRPHSARPSPWAFPGAEAFHPPLSKATDRWRSGHAGSGNHDSPDAWLTRLEADVVIAFFGFNESYGGAAKLETYRKELRAFVRHTKSQNYNGASAPRLVLVSPIAFEDLSALHGTPDGRVENANLALYSAAMEAVSAEEGVRFVNLFAASQKWFEASEVPLTRDGVILGEEGYQKLARHLSDKLFGRADTDDPVERAVLDAVNEKNWVWHKLYKVPNGVHVHGRRHRPFGPGNYPHELKKLEEMTANRDRAIWAAIAGETFDLAGADAKTHPLPEIESNYRPSRKNGSVEYQYGDGALNSFTMADGYRIDLFASEREFGNLANPVQMAFDGKGRLWIATMPSYPHYRPGDPKPDDKLIILEDTDQDGKADRETVFADGLHLPTGFELAPEGVYVAQGNHLVLLRDTDGDDRADVREVVLSGFDDHDTHHVISAFCADPSGAIYMGEGTFLHSNVETAYGPVRSSNGGFFRYDPTRRRLERSARLSIPNPWGTAFDDFGQGFFLDTSDPNLRWMVPGTVSVPYGSFAPLPVSLLEKAHRVRPTSGLELVSSRHFPDEVQGDLLISNTIGFLGTKQHQMLEDGTGFQARFRHDLVTSSDGNFRPVDMEFAPDGSLYLVDWHNVLVGHMQHSARDPLRDHVHGRVYRITHESRPLVEPAKVAGASVEQLLENLKLPEYRTRYRTRRELRGRPAGEVLPALATWTDSLAATDPDRERHQLEALWVSWGLNQVDEDLLRLLLKAKDHRVRSAAVQVLRYTGHGVKDQVDLLRAAAQDDHGRVRLEAIAAASWLEPELGLSVTGLAAKAPLDDWIKPVLETAKATLSGQVVEMEKAAEVTTTLTGRAKELFLLGAEVYGREAHCATCHQEDGNGLPAAHFPPIAKTRWAQGDEERLIKLTLHGLMGPITVKGIDYRGLVPMTGFKALSDEEVAAVLTYVRNSFGNRAPAIMPEKVKSVRDATSDRKTFYDPAELLKQHPFVR